jgi:hypothetical protein
MCQNQHHDRKDEQDMIPQIESNITGERESFFSDVLEGAFRPAELHFAILVTLARNKNYSRFQPWRIDNLIGLIKAMRYRLRHDSWVQNSRAHYKRTPDPPLVTRMLISFWARVFGITVQDLCWLLNEEQDNSLRRAFGLKAGMQCHPQRISELHSALGGSDGKEEMHRHLRDLVCELLELEGVTEANVETAAACHTFDPVLSELGQGYGFDYFLTFVFWQGVFAQLEHVLSEELKPNGYSLYDLFTSYLEQLDEVVKTQDDLEAKLRNRLWSGKERDAVAPVSQTITNFLLKLDLDRLLVLYQKEVRKSHRGKKRIVVAVDAVLIELFGHHEGADWHWNNHEHGAIFGYKLHVIFSVTTGEPIAFYLHQEQDKDADVLDSLVQQARAALGVQELGIVLFDKGYWRVEEFNELVEQQRESIITPGKRYKSVKKAIADIQRRQWQRAGVNQRCAETTVFFGEDEIHFRLVVWKKLGRRVVKDEQGQRIKDVNGKVVTEPVIIIHSYLTNLSEVELEADQVLGMYSQRWGIEDFFEEAQNQYYIHKFPGTALTVVKRHIVLTFLLYTLVKRFQKLAAEWIGRAEYAMMELRRFGKEFFHVPIVYLLWLKAGRPKEQARRSTRHSGAFLRRFFAFTASP